ncbi:MAG TPA: metalloregulator ArsR/SmtB family transcription factor [Ktedonobacterales bacterium]|nr:metalloregulator ArsR/SmtB family transcription factor [Ktedonobacterales bacterium]
MIGWQDVTDLRVALRALGEDVRLNIMHQLAAQPETNVTDLVAALGVSQPLVSWHLRKLRRVGLIRTMRRGREVYCSLDAARFANCLRALAELVEPSPTSADDGGSDAAPLAPVTLAAARGRGVRPRPMSRTRSRAGPLTTCAPERDH